MQMRPRGLLQYIVNKKLLERFSTVPGSVGRGYSQLHINISHGDDRFIPEKHAALITLVHKTIQVAPKTDQGDINWDDITFRQKG